MNFLKIISALFKSKASTIDKIDCDEEVKQQNWDIKLNDLGIFAYNTLGFDIDLKEGFHSIRWADIERLQAYKADLLTTDEICIDMTFNNKTILITEETKGWHKFISELNSALSLTIDDWEDQVHKTPFEYSFITIYERADRIMPVATNFYSVIKNKTKEDINYIFQKWGFTIRKSSMTDFEMDNSWAALVLESDKESLLLHGLVAFHPVNVKAIMQLFHSLQCTWQFEFYENDVIVEQAYSEM